MKPAICTQCFGTIEVDETHEAGICRFCGTPFITEKAINQYITQHQTTHNVTNNITKVIQGNEKDEGEDFYERGLTFLKIGQYSDAQNAFREAVKLSPERGIYHFYLFYAESDGLAMPTSLRHTPSPMGAFFKLATPQERAQVAREYGLSVEDGFEAFALDLVSRGLAGEIEGANLYYYLVEAAAMLGSFPTGRYYLNTLEGKDATYRKMAAGIIGLLKKKGVLESNSTDVMIQAIKEVFRTVCAATLPHMTEEEKREFFANGGAKRLNRVAEGLLHLEEPAFMPEYRDGVLRINDPEIYAINIKNIKGGVRRLVLGPSFGREVNRVAYSDQMLSCEIEYEEGFDFSRYFRGGNLPLPFLGNRITVLPSSFPMTTATVSYGDMPTLAVLAMAFVFPEGYPIHTDGYVENLQGICLPSISCKDSFYPFCTPGIIQGNTVYYPRLWKITGKGMRANKLVPEQKARFREALEKALGKAAVAEMTFIDPSEQPMPKKPGFFARLFGKK